MSAQITFLSVSILDDGSEWHSLILSNLSSSLYYISGERSGACGYGQIMHCLLPILLLSADIILEELRRSFGEFSHKLLSFDISAKWQYETCIPILSCFSRTWLFQSFITVLLAPRGLPRRTVYYFFAWNGITFSILTGRTGGLVTI
jgi:hypothetical protein